MATLWAICGAGKGVGKTHLALALCRLLPNAVYAKRGSSPPKPGKPANYFRTEDAVQAFVDAQSPFHDHVVVECNRWASEGRGDVIIFVGGVPTKPPRHDIAPMRSKAHIHVEEDSDPEQWELALREVLSSAGLRRALLDVLLEQRAFAGGVRPHWG